MVRQLIMTLMAVCCMTGCATPWMQTSIPQGLTDRVAGGRSSSPDQPPLMVSLNRDEIDFDILPVGSYVSIDCADGCRCQGTIVRRNQAQVELANCLQTTIVTSGDGRPAATTCSTPVQVVDRLTATRVTVMSLPSPKFNPPEMKFENDDTEVTAIEFCSGRLQSWVHPHFEDGLSRDDHSLDEMVRAMTDVPAGSQIAFFDSLGSQYNAILLGATSEKLSLCCCVKKDLFQVKKGHSQTCLNYSPNYSCPIESICTFSVVAAPPPNFDAADFDRGCELCIADWIYKSGRRQSQWKLARDDLRMQNFWSKNIRPLQERTVAKLSNSFSVHGAE